MTQSAEPVPDRPAAAEIRGLRHYPGWLTVAEQEAMVEALRAVVQAAPLFSPMTPYGREMSVRMTSAGRFGWVSDRRGYRYSESHPSGGQWPAIPAPILAIWQAVSGTDRSPECCLVNFYGAGARMGLHQDRDEADFTQPVVSISLGDDGLFRIGNATRGGSTQSLWLRSGDVLVMGGTARLLYHGIDRIAPGTSTLLPAGGRINLTLRVVT
jgi:alkylated DNA repair protein (DNA oxidative demethylase)